MASSQCFPSDWQISKTSLKERNKHMFNNSLITDVSFSVKASSAQEEKSALLIPAHKYVLAISSPVFFAMFYGHMADGSRTVELADCDSDTFLELLRFVYYDEVELTGANVFKVLYLAEKYMIPALSEECCQFLQDHLDASNVFEVLAGARHYEKAGLVEGCLQVVDNNCEEAMRSEAFLDISRDLLKEILIRDFLIAKEVSIFRAVDQWVEHQCKKTGQEVTRDKKKQLLGDAIDLIRFPLMMEETFSAIVPKTGLLSEDEIADVLRHFNGVRGSSRFPDNERRGNIPVSRFVRPLSEVVSRGWVYTGRLPGYETDAVDFVTGCDVSIHGVRLFGSPGGEYTVIIEIFHKGNKLTEEVGTFISAERKRIQGTTKYYYYSGYDVLFRKPVVAKKDLRYQIRALIMGPNSDYGVFLTRKLTPGYTYFSFLPANFGWSRGEDQLNGQFPEILFRKLKPVREKSTARKQNACCHEVNSQESG